MIHQPGSRYQSEYSNDSPHDQPRATSALPKKRSERSTPWSGYALADQEWRQVTASNEGVRPCQSYGSQLTVEPLVLLFGPSTGEFDLGL